MAFVRLSRLGAVLLATAMSGTQSIVQSDTPEEVPPKRLMREERKDMEEGGGRGVRMEVDSLGKALLQSSEEVTAVTTSSAAQPAMAGGKPASVALDKAIEKLQKLAGLVAWFRSEEAAPVWPSLVGNYTGQVLAGEVFNETKRGHGAMSEVKYLTGDARSQYSFGDVLQPNFTLCSVSRYTGENKGRILTGSSGNLLHGHWSGKSGVAYYDGWVSQKGDQDSTNWIVLCGTNAAKLLLWRGENHALKATHRGGEAGLVINSGPFSGPGETSDWALAELLVWNRPLRRSEMTVAYGYLMQKLNGGFQAAQRLLEQVVGNSAQLRKMKETILRLKEANRKFRIAQKARANKAEASMLEEEESSMFAGTPTAETAETPSTTDPTMGTLSDAARALGVPMQTASYAEAVCPWFFDPPLHSGTDLLRCYRGECDPQKDPDKWNCCLYLGGTFQCPQGQPYMCAGNQDLQDFPCVVTAADCNLLGGRRPCEGPPGLAGANGTQGEAGEPGGVGPPGLVGAAGLAGYDPPRVRKTLWQMPVSIRLLLITFLINLFFVAAIFGAPVVTMKAKDLVELNQRLSRGSVQEVLGLDLFQTSRPSVSSPPQPEVPEPPLVPEQPAPPIQA